MGKPHIFPSVSTIDLNLILMIACYQWVRFYIAKIVRCCIQEEE